MRKADDGLRALIINRLKKPDWHLTPIETGGTSDGVPDLHYLHRPSRAAGWLECKSTSGWAVKVEPHQVKWLTVHEAAGVRCSLAVRARGVGSGGPQREALWLLHGSCAGLLAEGGLRAVQSAGLVTGIWYGPPAAWDWRAIGEYLAG